MMKIGRFSKLFHPVQSWHPLQRQNCLGRAIDAFSTVIKSSPQASMPWFHPGEITPQLSQFNKASLFSKRVCNLGRGMLKSFLYLCARELRQNRFVDFIRWCDLILKEHRLSRNKTIHNFEDISAILQEISIALIDNRVLSSQVSNLLSLMP
ncbi:MAG: hypothetical protein ACLP9S_13005 [Syntrophales bacterium]